MTIAERLFNSLADNANPDSLASRMRATRFRAFADILAGVREPVRILDVGGTPTFWLRHMRDLPVRAEVTLLNRRFDDRPAGVSYIIGDARHMGMFGDFLFDACFSNSVIEHVGTFADQMSVAREIRRVARGYFVQTPNRYFPIEPHALTVGWQFAPASVRAWLLQRRDWGWIRRETSRSDALAVVRSIRLLTVGELRELFPEAEIQRERIGPLTKSLVALQRPRTDTQT